MSEWSLSRRMLRRVSGGRAVPPEGRAGIAVLGHRDYVGGLWEQVGRLQFEFMLGRGLQPGDVLLDIACGSLRGGVHFIRYLDDGNYLGIDKEKRLIDMGVDHELGRETFVSRRPEFVVSDNFDFGQFSKRPSFSLAQSLFTHLTDTDIEVCLANLRDVVDPGHRFFATFFEGSTTERANHSHAHREFRYTPDHLEALAARHAWDGAYIGDWSHPREQVMMQFTAVESQIPVQVP
jgi:hypothetical protein